MRFVLAIVCSFPRAAEANFVSRRCALCAFLCLPLCVAFGPSLQRGFPASVSIPRFFPDVAVVARLPNFWLSYLSKVVLLAISFAFSADIPAWNSSLTIACNAWAALPNPVAISCSGPSWKSWMSSTKIASDCLGNLSANFVRA